MKTTVEALKDLYVKRGGYLTDVHEGICDGAPVGAYVTIPDMIEALAAVESGSDPVDEPSAN